MWSSARPHFREGTFAKGLVAAASVSFAACFGWNYGLSNQASYLLRGLNSFNPQFLQSDWLMETTDFHPVFSKLAWLLYELDPSGFIFAVANVAALTAGALLVFGLIACVLRPGGRLAVFLLVLAIGVLSDTSSVAGSYIFYYVFQPSTVGALAYLGAALYFVRGRYLLSGLILGAGGLFHANFVFLALGWFGLAHLLLRESAWKHRLVQQLAGPLAALLALSPLLALMLLAPGGESAREILMYKRASHHYVVDRFYLELIPFLGWQMLALAGIRLSGRAGTQTSRLRTLLLSGLILVWGATALATVSDAVAMLFVWRIAPFCDLLAQIVFLQGLYIYWREPSVHLLDRFTVALLAAGTLSIGLSVPESMVVLLPATLLASAAVWTWLRGRRLLQLRQATAFLGVGALLWSLAVVTPLTNSLGLLRVIVTQGWEMSLALRFPEEFALYNWARSTPRDTVFIVPPDLHHFRIFSRRSVLADWKTVPILPGEIEEWYERVKLISGVTEIEGGRAVAEGFSRLNVDRIRKIRSRYNFDYIVLRKPGANPIPGCPSVFENRSFIVLAAPTQES